MESGLIKLIVFAVLVILSQIGKGMEKKARSQASRAAKTQRRTTPPRKTGLDVLADLGQLDVDDVAERVLRVVGDAHAHGALVTASGADPLVLAGVLQVIGIHGVWLLSAAGPAYKCVRVSSGRPSRVRRTAWRGESTTS